MILLNFHLTRIFYKSNLDSIRSLRYGAHFRRHGVFGSQESRRVADLDFFKYADELFIFESIEFYRLDAVNDHQIPHTWSQTQFGTSSDFYYSNCLKILLLYPRNSDSHAVVRIDFHSFELIVQMQIMRC